MRKEQGVRGMAADARHRVRAERRLPTGAATAHLLRTGGELRGRGAVRLVGSLAMGTVQEMRRGAGAERPRAQPRFTHHLLQISGVAVHAASRNP